MSWWQRLWHRKELDQQLDRELQFHIAERTSALKKTGLSEQEARRLALAGFGGMEQSMQACREARGTAWLESTLQDIRYNARVLREAPAFTLAAIATLALGIGANTAIFQLLDAVRLRSLPVVDPGKLAQIRIGNGRGFGVSHYPDNLSYPLLEQIRDHQQAFSGIAAWDSGYGSENIGREGEARAVPVIRVSGDFFSTLGVSPAAGRMIRPEDDVRGCTSPVVVLSYAFWQREFAGQASAIGQRLMIDRQPLEIIGVTPPRFDGPEIGKKFDLALPLCSHSALHGDTVSFNRRDFFWLNVLARLKPGWTFERATDQLQVISGDIMRATLPSGYSSASLERYRAFRLASFPGGKGISRLREEYDQSLWVLLGLTGMVLLIACANLSNLVLARASAREREFAVRLALGAGRSRLMRQSLIESLMLAASGAVLGAGLAAVLSRIILTFLGRDGNRVPLDLAVDWRMLAFTTGVTSATCILLGIAPALRGSRTEPCAAMKSGSRGLTLDRRRFSFQRGLVVIQVSVSLVLVSGAFLFVSSFRRLVAMDAGFSPSGVLTAEFDVPREEAVLRQLLEQVRSTPPVDSAAATTNFLLGGGSWSLGIRTDALNRESKFTWVSPGYFATLTTPILSGRDFNSSDTVSSPRVAVINQIFANLFFPGEDPIGKTFRTIAEPHYPAAEYQIVGLIRNTSYFSLQERQPPMAYGPITQYPPGPAGTLIYIRSSAPLAGVEAAVRRRVAEWRPGTDMDFRVFEQQISNSLNRERLLAALSGFFGALAALLATIGLYSVLAYNAARRRDEIGIRMALGASRGQVVRLMLREAVLLVPLGIGIGVACSLAAGRVVESLLYGVSPHDPARLGGAAAALVVAAAIGSLLPALRASRVHPMLALRDE